MMHYDTAEMAETLFEECGDALFLFDPETEQLVDVNPMAMRLTGMTHQELCRSPLSYYFRGEKSRGLQVLRQACRKTGQFHSREGFLLRHREGPWIPVNLTISRLHTETRTLGLITARDIRERRAAESSREQSAAELDRVLAAVSAYLFSADVDRNGNWSNGYFSPTVEALSGLPAEVLATSREHWLATFHAEDRIEVQALLDRVVRGPDLENEGEFRIIRPDGTMGWVGVRLVLDLSRDRRERRLGGVVQDITGRKKAEEHARFHALKAEQVHRDSEVRYRTLIENLEQAIFLKDTQFRFLACNQRFVTSLGRVNEAEILGKTDEDFFPPELVEQFRVDDRRVLTEGKRLEVEERFLENGQWRTIRTVKNPLKDEFGNVVAVLGIFWDVTEQRSLEGQLRQMQKMEAVGQLAGGIAHDFNNLLTAILGNLSLILDDLPQSSPYRTLVEAADKAAQRAANLTAQLLGFSRRTLLRTEPLNLNVTLEEVAGILRRTIDPRVVLDPRPGTDLWNVEADPGQMTQIVMNMCLNARDAMPQGGHLKIETENTVLTREYARLHLQSREGEYVRLRISDTGHGIPQEIRSRIFEPFFTTKGQGKGTGLGLAMVFGIVQQHRGWIDCYSEVEKGTRFDIYLPRHHGNAEPVSVPRKKNPVPRGTETILLADDEEMIRTLGAAILKPLGYNVLLASDGCQAVKLYQSERDRIDLVILDLTMPNMSGRDAFRQIRAVAPQARVLFASGYSADHLVDGEEIQASGFVGKPYRPEELARTVRDVLDQTGRVA